MRRKWEVCDDRGGGYYIAEDSRGAILEYLKAEGFTSLEDAAREFNETVDEFSAGFSVREVSMVPSDIFLARQTLGRLWGLGREVSWSELGHILRLKGDDPGESIRRMESGHDALSGPMSVAIEAMLGGYKPRDLRESMARGEPDNDRLIALAKANARARNR
jgi:hypothetical protein